MRNYKKSKGNYLYLLGLFLIVGIILQYNFVRPAYAQTLDADANNDGKVDGLDYLVWQLHYGETVVTGKSEGDFNQDTLVNGIDFVIFLNNYGQSAPSPTISQTGNIALHKTVTASSNDADAPNPSAVTDGDTTTRWSSAWSQPQWVQIDLGQSFTISRVILNWQRSYGSGYRIEVSDNASTWTSIYTTTTGNGTIDDLSNLNGHGRYIRMYGTQRACDSCGATLYGFSLFEFEVYATSQGGATQTPTTTLKPSISPTRTPSSSPTSPNASPTTTAGVCYVKVAGVLYNMQSAIGKKLIDPNTNKSHTHSISNFKCGTLASPTDMTSTYLGKHLKLGCSPRLAPYVVTPPAPDDPTCV